MANHLTTQTSQFSGASIEEGRWWVYLTATVDHAGLPHLVNNMLMLAMGAAELEALLATAFSSPALGAVAFVTVFLGTAAAGWGTTLVVTRWRYHGEEWDCAAKFQGSVGSSPGTYGLAACLAFAAPRACVCGALGGAWPSVGLLIFAPMACGTKYGVQPWVAPTRDNSILLHGGSRGNSTASGGERSEQLFRFAAFVVFAVVFSAMVLKPVFGMSLEASSSVTGGGCGLTGAGTFMLYLGWCGLRGVVDSALFRFARAASGEGADHSCHFGGALVGAAIGFSLRQQDARGGTVQQWSISEALAACCMALLAVRAWNSTRN